MLTILLVGGKTAGERKPLLRGFSEGHLGRPCPGVCVGRHAVRSSVAVMDQCGSASGKTSSGPRDPREAEEEGLCLRTVAA